MTGALIGVFAAGAIALVVLFLACAVLTRRHAEHRTKMAEALRGYVLADREAPDERARARARLGTITIGDLVREPALYAAAIDAARARRRRTGERPRHDG